MAVFIFFYLNLRLGEVTSLSIPLLQNRVLQERLSHMETQLQASEDDCQRLRSERDGLRDRLTDLQLKLSEKEAEVRSRPVSRSD